MKLKKFFRALAIGAATVAIGGAAALSGCTIETNHARAKITVEFNGETYVLQYTLYRNMYPVTVRHFIELANAGFYDDTIIHDYASNDWYGGGYAYAEEETDKDDVNSYSTAYSHSAMDEYLENNDKEQDYLTLFKNGTFTSSVFTDYDYNDSGEMIEKAESAYHTVYGEFSNNGHTIANGQRDSEFGCLKMYYTTKVIEDTAAAHVFIKTNKKEVIEEDYKYNSATSLFAMQVGSSSSLSTSSYASFGYLRNDDAEDTLNDLLDAISDYIDDNYNDDSSKFTSTAEDVLTDNIETIAEPATSVSYTVTAEPIIIRTVKITKY